MRVCTNRVSRGGCLVQKAFRTLGRDPLAGALMAQKCGGASYTDIPVLTRCHATLADSGRATSILSCLHAESVCASCGMVKDKFAAVVSQVQR